MGQNSSSQRSSRNATRIETSAKVHLEKTGEEFKIARIELKTEGEVPGIDEATFLEHPGQAARLEPQNFPRPIT